ncbi:MAG: IS200/IS605 family transposase [Candidatus Kapaibacterium sp.]
MADTFSQIYVQIVFAVRNRNAFIQTEWEERLYQYITGIVRNHEQKMIAINGISNHIHLFIGLKPTCRISDLVREIKKSSTEFVNDNHLSKYKFSWQEGYGVFSYSNSQVDSVAKYVMNQKEHHRKTTFKEEYIDLLQKFNVEFKDEHLFDWIDV